MTSRTTTSIALLVALLVAAFLLGRCSATRPLVDAVDRIEYVRKTDTTVEVRWRERVVVHRPPVISRPQTPEDIAVAPLPSGADSSTAFVDSTSVAFASGDTVSASYAYPQRTFLSVVLRPRPDSTITIRDSVERRIFVKPSPVSFGVFGGYGFSPTTNSFGWTVGAGVLVNIWSLDL